MQKLDVFNVRKQKKYRVLVEYIWQRRNTATRADITRDLHLSNATVFPAIDQMVRAGIVEGAPMPTEKKGRKPSCLRICGRQCFALGISINQYGVDINAVNAAQDVICREKIAELPRDCRTALDEIVPAVKKILVAHKLDAGRMVGVGVTLPGFIDARRGIAWQSTCLPGGADVSIKDFFEKAFDKPCMVLGCAPTLALTEKEWGKAADMSTFLYFAGMGLGMFTNGQLFTGHQSYAGEIGFMKFDEGKTPDVDGRQGTFHWASPFRQMGARLEKAIGQGAQTILADWLRDGRAMSVELIVEAAMQGDVLCRNLVAEGFQVVAEMLVSLNYLLNPEAIFLLPWTGECPEISLDIIRRRLELCRVINPDMQVKVLAAQYGRDDLARGIAMLPLNHFFNMENHI